MSINTLKVLENSSINLKKKSEPSKGSSPSVILSPRPEKITSVNQLFGWSHGYLYLALDLSSEYTDNLYNVDFDRQNNVRYQLTPTVRITLPGRKWTPLHMAPHNTSPGGLQFSLRDTEQFDKYQFYLLGNLDFLKYSTNSELDTIHGKVEGSFQYKMTGHITVQLIDMCTANQDQFESQQATIANRRSYYSNLIRAGSTWDFTEKFSTMLDYKNFTLFYKENINNILNRTDNGLSWKLNYDYSRKTNFYLQLEYMYSTYDTYKEKNNSNKYIFLGTDWRITDKTSLMAKAGYQKNSYNDILAEEQNSTFSFELQSKWQMTVKTALALGATYGIEQSNSTTALSKRVLSGRIAYEQKFTDRFRTLIKFLYEYSNYNQFDDSKLFNHRYYFSPRLQYAFRKWLTGELFYTHDILRSTETPSNYSSNTINLNLRFSF